MSRSLLAAMLIGGAVCAGVLAVRALGLLQGVELALYEGYLADRAARDATPSPVVIVKLTDADRRELGHWPVNDATLARALERLGAAGARVIGIDLARDLAVPPGSDALDARLRSDARIIGVRSFPDGAASDIPPAPALVGTDRVGFAEMLPDPDGRVRRALLFQADGSGRVEYAFALRVALAYLREAGAGLANEPDAPELVRLGPTAIPRLGPQAGGYVDADAGGYQFLIDFDRAAPGFESLRFTDLLRDELDLSLLRDRVVLIGATAAGAHDIFDTPVASRLEAGGGVPGVELHAHITDQLVRFGLGESPPLDVLPDWAELASIAAVVALGAGVGLAVRSVWLFGALILAGLGLIWVAGLQLFAVGWWAPVAGPGLGWVASGGDRLGLEPRARRTQPAHAALLAPPLERNRRPGLGAPPRVPGRRTSASAAARGDGDVPRHQGLHRARREALSRGTHGLGQPVHEGDGEHGRRARRGSRRLLRRRAQGRLRRSVPPR
jgi:adenylate cyclase